MNLSRTLPAAILLALVACRENAGSNTDAAPTWRAELVTTLGGDSGEASFSEVNSLLLGPQGVLYVLDRRAGEVKLFDSTGAFVRGVGRIGAGPGEYREPYSMAWLGDTLAILDPRNARIGLFDKNWAWAGQLPVGPITGGNNVKLFRTHASTFWAYGHNGDRLFVRYTSSGAHDTVPYLFPPSPARTAISCQFPDRSIGFFRAPFAPTILEIPNATGERAIASTDAYRITFLGASGDTLRAIARDVVLEPIPDSAWEAGLQDWIETRKNPAIKCDGDSFDRPAGKPILAALFYDDQGRLWVEVHAATGVRYDLYDLKGDLVGAVTGLPPSNEIDPAVRGGRIALTYLDEAGSPRVGVYRLKGAP